MHCLSIGSATGPHGHDPGLISRDDDKKALSGKQIFIYLPHNDIKLIYRLT